jgi:lysophospholipase L1-like esterase
MLTASADTTSVTLSISAGLSGGSGSGYTYRIYRDTSPNFSPGPKSLLATSATLESTPYLDRDHLNQGAVYFYKVVGVDGAGDTVGAVPAGLTGAEDHGPLSTAAELTSPAIDVVYIGDSITQGNGLSDPEHEAAPARCSQALQALVGGKHGQSAWRPVYFSNQGHSGHTTKDYLPGGGDMAGAEAAAKTLQAAHPGTLVFSIMLGTNDSATSGTNGAAASVATFTANTKAIVDHLLADFPACKVVIHHAIWYSPNTHNFSDYQEVGLSRLTSYFPAIDRLAASYVSRHRHVFVGDTAGFGYFAAHYQTDLQAESGTIGTFYLHPNAVGAVALGDFWAAAIAKCLNRD